jgi:hypothetical protein
MITYTWGISRLDCAPSENGLTNIVKVIHWTLTGVDENGITESFNNSYPLPSPTPESFTDYSTLAQETVIGWLESNLDVGYLQTYLANEIESKYHPPIIPLPLPWMKVEAPVVEEVIEEPVEPTLEEKIADGYNPDARDGDDDGIVQEGTEWERPLGTEL